MKKKLYINGEWHESEQYIDLHSPYLKEKLAEIPQASNEQVNFAIDTAHNNREAMARLTAYERAEILEKLVSLLRENRLKAAEIHFVRSCETD